MNARATDTRALLPAEVAGTWFLLDVANVHEVLGPTTWLPIPEARSELPGVIAWRGRAVPVLDPAAFLPHVAPLARREVRPRALIVQVDRNTLSIPVERARETASIPLSELRPLHAASARYADVETQLGGVAMAVLELSRIVRDLFESAHAGASHVEL